MNRGIKGLGVSRSGQVPGFIEETLQDVAFRKGYSSAVDVLPLDPDFPGADPLVPSCMNVCSDISRDGR